MADDRHSEVLGGLPRTRPHRRSDKRASAGPNGVKPETTETTEPAEPAGAEPAAAKPAAAKPAASGPAEHKPAAPKPSAHKPAARKPPAPRRVVATPSGAGAAVADAPGKDRIRQPSQPAGGPPAPKRRGPVPINGADIVGTAVQAAAELTEIGLTVTARALRGALRRLPRP
jgi:hypothetical protein